jgi:hypothetical protein
MKLDEKDERELAHVINRDGFGNMDGERIHQFFKDPQAVLKYVRPTLGKALADTFGIEEPEEYVPNWKPPET